jgi:hypothetical protein
MLYPASANATSDAHPATLPNPVVYLPTTVAKPAANAEEIREVGE